MVVVQKDKPKEQRFWMLLYNTQQSKSSIVGFLGMKKAVKVQDIRLRLEYRSFGSHEKLKNIVWRV